MSGKKAFRSGRSARFMIGLQVVLSIVLALTAVFLLNHLAGRPGVRVRMDLTDKEVNSLDVATQRVLDSLPGEVTVDVFFRGEQAPMTDLVAQVQMRTNRLLERMKSEASDRFVIHQNDLLDVTAIRQRQEILRLRGLENCVVVHHDGKVQVVRLFGGLASFDLGNPHPDRYRPPSLVSFDGEISILKAIMSVTRGGRPKLIFTTGHGEMDPYGDGHEEGGALESLLREDGFVINTWNPREEESIPEGTTILAVVKPVDDMGDSARAKIRRFVDAGGRLLIAAAPDPIQLRSSRMGDWVKTFGIELTQGTVMEPFPDALGTGLLTGEPSVNFTVKVANMRRHAIVEPFMDTGRSFLVSRSHGVRVARQPEQGTGMSMPLFASNSKLSWLDTVPLDYAYDPEVETLRSFDLAVASEYSVLSLDDAQKEGEERTRSRVIVLGSSDFLASQTLNTTVGRGSSRDLALNLFNWLGSREWRVNISPKDPDLRLLPFDKVATLNRIVVWGLPLVFLCMGLLVAFFRSRGGPQRVRS